MNSVKPHKILFIMPSMNVGGAEKALLNLLKLFDPNSFELELIVLKKGGKFLQGVPKFVSVQALYSNNISEKISRYFCVKFGINYFVNRKAKAIKGFYDCMISFQDGLTTDYALASSAQFKKTITVVQSSYISYSNKSKYRKGRYLERIKERYNAIDKIVIVSKDSAKEFQKLFGHSEKIVVINNPIDSEGVLRSSISKFNEKKSKSKRYFCALGSLLPVKGFERLIEATYRLKSKGYDFELLIMGQGVLYEKLQKLISSLGLEMNVFLTGYIENPYPYIKQSDVFVVSSFSEGWPTVVCESLVLGKAILSTNITGSREVLEYGKYGMLVDDNVDGLVKGMELFMNQNTLYKYTELAVERGKMLNDIRIYDSYKKIIL